MEHCVLNLSVDSRGSLKISMVEEFSNDLKIIANSDILLETGTFTFTDPNGKYLGKLENSNITGLSYGLYGEDGTLIATCRYEISLISKPIYFEVDVIDPYMTPNDEILWRIHSNPSFSCFADPSGPESEMDINTGHLFMGLPPTSRQAWSPTKSTTEEDDEIKEEYTKYEDHSTATTKEEEEDIEVNLTATKSSLGALWVTRRPSYNHETRCYLHNFGSRVKLASNNNFVMVNKNEGDSSIEDDTKRVLIRFGKIAEWRQFGPIMSCPAGQQYVLDYRRSEVPRLLAIAIALSTLTPKALVM